MCDGNRPVRFGGAYGARRASERTTVWVGGGGLGIEFKAQLAASDFWALLRPEEGEDGRPAHNKRLFAGLSLLRHRRPAPLCLVAHGARRPTPPLHVGTVEEKKGKKKRGLRHLIE